MSCIVNFFGFVLVSSRLDLESTFNFHKTSAFTKYPINTNDAQASPILDHRPSSCSDHPIPPAQRIKLNQTLTLPNHDSHPLRHYHHRHQHSKPSIPKPPNRSIQHLTPYNVLTTTTESLRRSLLPIKPSHTSSQGKPPKTSLPKPLPKTLRSQTLHHLPPSQPNPRPLPSRLHAPLEFRLHHSSRWLLEKSFRR